MAIQLEPIAADDIRPDTGTKCESNIYARTFPGPSHPFGQVQLGPDCISGWDFTNGYSADFKTIEGFSFNRLSGVGAYGDFGNLQTMPTTGPMLTHAGQVNHERRLRGRNGWRSRFFHRDETIRSGYYSVLLHTYNILTELTCTAHCGIMRMTFPQADQSRIQIDLARRIGGTSLEQEVEVVSENAIEGKMVCGPEGGGFRDGAEDLRYTVHFRFEVDRPIETCGVWSADIAEDKNRHLEYVNSGDYDEAAKQAEVLPGARKGKGKQIGFYLEFPTEKGEVVQVKAGLSFVDIEGARNNLTTELDHWDFDSVRSRLVAAWGDALAGLRIAGATQTQRAVTATALYHCKLDPRYFADVDNRYRSGDAKIRVQEAFRARTVFSGWDAFRSYFPLMTLLDPELVNDQVNTLLEVATMTGEGFPKWELVGVDTKCMLGDPAVAVILDAYVKGIRDYDVDLAYELSRETAFGPRTHRDNLEAYTELGYAPERVSVTLENCYADWCIYQFAKELGKDDDVALFEKRLLNYQNIYCPEVKLMRGRTEDGSWIPWEGGTTFGQGCTESNPLQQTWFVPHDAQGLINLMGEDVFLSQLEDMFDRTPKNYFWNPYYNHSNEPVHQLVYIFPYAGKPWLTQKWARDVMQNAYGLGPEGLCGNDDVGQMSAWYLLSAMGIHPFCTGSGIYIIGSPLFEELEVELNPKYSKADKLRIIARDNSKENVYVQAAMLGGKPLDRAWVTHDELTSGGELEFEMGPEPNKSWATAPENRPPSVSDPA
jgi:predicted alpha-1,2-mannosidase